VWTQCLASVPRMQCWPTRAMPGEISARPDGPAANQQAPVRLAGSGSPPAGPRHPAARAVSRRGPPYRRDDRPDPPAHVTQAQLVQALGFTTGSRTPPGAVEHLHPTRPDHTARVEPSERSSSEVCSTGGAHQHLLPAARRVGEPGAEHAVVPGPMREHHDRVHSALPGAPTAPRAPPPPCLRPHDPAGRACQPTPSTTTAKRPPGPSWPQRISPAGPGRECCRSEPLDPRCRESVAQFSPGSLAGGTPIRRASAGRIDACSRPTW